MVSQTKGLARFVSQKYLQIQKWENTFYFLLRKIAPVVCVKIINIDLLLKRAIRFAIFQCSFVNKIEFCVRCEQKNEMLHYIDYSIGIIEVVYFLAVKRLSISYLDINASLNIQ